MTSPDTIILLIADYHAVIVVGGKTPCHPPPLPPCVRTPLMSACPTAVPSSSGARTSDEHVMRFHWLMSNRKMPLLEIVKKK